jgi:hypothetical protein
MKGGAGGLLEKDYTGCTHVYPIPGGSHITHFYPTIIPTFSKMCFEFSVKCLHCLDFVYVLYVYKLRIRDRNYANLEVKYDLWGRGGIINADWIVLLCHDLFLT